MHPYKRSARVRESLKEVLARIVQQDLKEPDLGLVTVTDVELSDDLRSARVYFTCLGDEKRQKETRQLLKQSIPRIKGLISRRMRLKYMPELQFRYDPTYETGQRIDSILEKIKHEDGSQT